MCGRARCTLTTDQVAAACNLDPSSTPIRQADRYRPLYNVAPGAYMPVVRRERDGGSDNGESNLGSPVVHCMKWGLVPSFTKKSEKPDHFRMFNARSESIKEKASFRRLIPTKRCVVAVEGFYEWKKDGSKKQPYYIHFKDDRPLVFAALYDYWTSDAGETLYTFTILTTRCSSSLEWLHDRMPVILGSKCDIDTWLSDSSPKLDILLVPYEKADLVWYPVSPEMGKLSFQGPECFKEVHVKAANEKPISKFFSKKSYAKSERDEQDSTEDHCEQTRQDNCDSNCDSHNTAQKPKEEPMEIKPSVLPTLEQRLDNEEAEGTPRQEKVHLDESRPVKKEDTETDTRHSKRDHEELESRSVLTKHKLSSGPVNKKEKIVSNTGDKQATLHSFFGKK